MLLKCLNRQYNILLWIPLILHKWHISFKDLYRTSIRVAQFWLKWLKYRILFSWTWHSGDEHNVFTKIFEHLPRQMTNHVFDIINAILIFDGKAIMLETFSIVVNLFCSTGMNQWEKLTKEHIIWVLEAGGIQILINICQSCQWLILAASQCGPAIIQALNAAARDENRYLTVPSNADQKVAMLQYIEATSNEALWMSVCGVCARECNTWDTTMKMLAEIPNLHHLQPTEIHDNMTLMDGLLITD